MKLLCYISEELEDVEETDQPDNTVDDEVITVDLSHLHTLNGHPSSRPLMVIGAIAWAEVRVLIDTGATMDFLHPRVAASLQLELTPIRPFRVLVGNGASLLCTHVSRQTKLTMQGNLFPVDLHILEHHGPDVILGMAWLESLGKISADFVKKMLEFSREGRKVFLTGVAQGPTEISRQSLALLTAHFADHELYEVVRIDHDDGGRRMILRRVFPQISQIRCDRCWKSTALFLRYREACRRGANLIIGST